jgi:ligand-binding sensor domain-containing protein/signal transduction histidine kinase/DNA-binding response OmpR family regulator
MIRFVNAKGICTLSPIVALFIAVFMICPVVKGDNATVKFQTLQDGLSHPQVKCILKDSKGFMWFGTHDGLNRFDGTRFVVYETNPDDVNSLCHNIVNAIIEDQSQTIWIGTANGLTRYNRDKDRFDILEDFGVRDILYISALCCDHEGNIWIGTSGNGLFVYNQRLKRLDSYVHNDQKTSSIVSNFVTAIVEDKDNNMWIGTRKGLEKFDNLHHSFIHFESDSPNKSSINQRFITAMTLDYDGCLWAGTCGGGLYKLKKRGSDYDVECYQHADLQGSISGNFILSLLVDRDANLWVGTENGGLNCLDSRTQKFTCYRTEDGNPRSIKSNSIWSLYQDDIGLLWIGTYNKGVNIVDENFDKFDTYQRNGTARLTLGNNHVKGFSEDRNGILWIATDGGGVSCFNTHTRQFTSVIPNSSLSSLAVMSVLCDSQQNIWVGTWGGGIDRFDCNGRKIRNYSVEGNVKNGPNNAACLYQDSYGNIWVGTSGNGLFVYNSENDRFVTLEGVSHQANSESGVLGSTSYVNVIMETSDHRIWVGTSYGLGCLTRLGMGRYTLSEFLHSNKAGSISSFRVTTLFEDSHHNLWVGTEEGLNRFDAQGQTFTVFRKQHGLLNNTINGILEDAAGHLWISTNRGISKFDSANSSFEHFTKDDGLVSSEFNVRSCIKTQMGEFFWGGNNGMNAFYPDHIKMNHNIAPVCITNLMIDNVSVNIGADGSPLQKNISETSQLVLNHEQTSFSIEFVALNYTHPSKNQYAFMLEGFDKDWNYVGNRRLASYTNLDAGTYLFKVKGSNNDGLWNETPTTIEIIIRPPYWKTFWAYGLYVLIFFALLWTVVRMLIVHSAQAEKLKFEILQRSHSEDLNKMKIQFFTNVSHELRTPLTLILSPLEQILSGDKVKDAIKDQLSMIYRNAGRMYELVNELMDFTKSEENRLKMNVQLDDIVRLTHNMFVLFVDEAQRREIDYRFLCAADHLMLWFDKNKMEKIMINLISNAFKYTPNRGAIEVRIGLIDSSALIQHLNLVQASGYVKIEVVDNGSGIPQSDIPKVFDRFYQSPEQGRMHKTGTGIGLALVKNFVELHHGHVSVTSDQWKETAFMMILPMGNMHFSKNDLIGEADQTDTKSFEKPDLLPQLKPDSLKIKNAPVVLVVEDNYELRRYIVSMLDAQYQILEAADGQAGCDIAFEHIPDLIISDIAMPIATGIELCQKVKGNINTSHVPVILLTSKTSVEDQIEGIENGADIYITKPFHADFLSVTIRKMIEARRQIYRHFSQDVYVMPHEMSNNDLDKKFLKQAIEYIETNVTNDEISVENLSACLLMSRSNVYRKIKALTGQTATEFIRTVRLKMAVKYLESGQFQVSEIAYKVGFASPGYFAKCFKSQFGKSPSEFLPQKDMVM